MHIFCQDVRQSQIAHFKASILFYYEYYGIPDVDKSGQEDSLDELYQDGKRLFELT
jgi:hypothetical protein